MDPGKDLAVFEQECVWCEVKVFMNFELQAMIETMFAICNPQRGVMARFTSGSNIEFYSNQVSECAHPKL